MAWKQSLQMAVDTANAAIKEDNKKNYEVALFFYDKSKGYFLLSIEQIAVITQNDELKEAIKKKSKSYEKRADQLRVHLAKTELLNKNCNVLS